MLKRLWGLALLAILTTSSLAGEVPKGSYPVVFQRFPPASGFTATIPRIPIPARTTASARPNRKFTSTSPYRKNEGRLAHLLRLVPRSNRPDATHLNTPRPQIADMLHVRVGLLAGTRRYPLIGTYWPSLTSLQWVNYVIFPVGLRYWWAWLIVALGSGWLGQRSWRGWRTAQQALRREEKRAELTAEMFRGDPLEGQQLGDYFLLSRVGEGGVGVSMTRWRLPISAVR